jgi:hypothetical protein
MTHLPEHTAVSKIESLTLLFEMTSFKENVPNFPFLELQCVLAKTQSSSMFWQTTENNGITVSYSKISLNSTTTIKLNLMPVHANSE